MTSLSRLSNGKIWISCWNCRECVGDKLTRRKKPRSTNNRVHRSFRSVNTDKASVEERYDTISSNASSSTSSSVVLILLDFRQQCLRFLLYMLSPCILNWAFPSLLSSYSSSSSGGGQRPLIFAAVIDEQMNTQGGETSKNFIKWPFLMFWFPRGSCQKTTALTTTLTATLPLSSQ